VDLIVPILMIVMGAAIAGVWTRDILRGEQVDVSQGLLAARDPDSGTLLWPHWLAEYATAGALVAAAVGLLLDTTGRRPSVPSPSAPFSTYPRIRWVGRSRSPAVVSTRSRC
jgi:hypothetical protein